jgi:hypothetical protein
MRWVMLWQTKGLRIGAPTASTLIRPKRTPLIIVCAYEGYGGDDEVYCPAQI